MYFIDSSCRRGTSTILGTLIFVGILFTAVIPMFLVMRQADIFYEKEKFNVGLLDEERKNEDIRVYVFPTPGSPEPPSLTVRIENRGDILVRVVRIWVNDQEIESDCAVQSMSEADMDPFDVSALPGNYSIKVTTDKGNKFTSDVAPIYYLGGGEWEIGMLVINVLIYNQPGGIYKIDVWWGAEEGEPTYNQIIQKSSGNAFTFFDVTENGSPESYHVKITRGSDIIYNNQVNIEWPIGPPVVWVFA